MWFSSCTLPFIYALFVSNVAWCDNLLCVSFICRRTSFTACYAGNFSICNLMKVSHRITQYAINSIQLNVVSLPPYKKVARKKTEWNTHTRAFTEYMSKCSFAHENVQYQEFSAIVMSHTLTESTIWINVDWRRWSTEKISAFESYIVVNKINVNWNRKLKAQTTD